MEERTLFAGDLPFGAWERDTGEYFLGDIQVNVIFMESDGTTDPDTETWTDEHRNEVKQKIEDSLQWWVDTLRNTETTHTHPLNFNVDYTYADNPISTPQEPISNISDQFAVWIYDFLDEVGYNNAGSFSADVREYNHAQRVASDSDWSFTILVVNSDNDGDDAFDPGGSFTRAFAYAGGRFYVIPSGRPASSYVHELGHMFWGRDEYLGGGTYTQRRGYYNTQNLNAADNPAEGFVQADSIMANGSRLTNAFNNNISSVTSLEMLGWRDTDHDGIFDVVDRPHTLTGSGVYDSDSGTYRFIGHSAVDTLPNVNSSGLQNDITINRIRRVEYRLDGAGDWLLAATPDANVADLDLSISVPPTFNTIEIRTYDDETGVASEIFQGNPETGSLVAMPGINGFMFNDVDENGTWDAGEPGLSGWTIQLVDGSGDPLDLTVDVTPDNFASGSDVSFAVPEATLSGTGIGIALPGVIAQNRGDGSNVFANHTSNTSTNSLWTPTSRQLRIDFTTPVSTVSITAIADTNSDYGRLEIYDINNTLLDRYTTSELSVNESERMRLDRQRGDIAYAIVRGHMSSVQLSDLEFGPESSAVTNSLGGYSIPYLLPTDYTVTATPPSDNLPAAVPGQIEVSLAGGQRLAGVDFHTHLDIVWQNTIRPTDLDDDNHVAPLDALYIINELNARGSRVLPLDGSEMPPPYFDVDGDGSISPRDALLVINELNGAGNGEAEGESSLVVAAASSDDDGAEGEFVALDTVLVELPALISASRNTVAVAKTASNHSPLVTDAVFSGELSLHSLVDESLLDDLTF